MKNKFAIAIHGGAGTLGKDSMTTSLQQQYLYELEKCLDAGVAVLKEGGQSLDAVEAAVTALEDCPLFNAGRGSVFNHEGKHEMDAAIMDGRTLSAGAVAVVRQIKNPIRLARAVLDTGQYVLLSGEQALAFAAQCHLPLEADEYFETESRFLEWKKKQEQGNNTDKANKFGTVGAVAVDIHGNLAAATSTGGLTNKKYGRIGDSCIIGAGTYANNDTCAVSCTGEGEAFIRAVAAYDLSCLIGYRGQSLEQASAEVIQNLQRVKGSGGLISVNRSGHIAMPFNTEGMYRACRHHDGGTEVHIF